MNETEIKTCAVCGRLLEEDDEGVSCPIYMDGVDADSDEHTSIDTRRNDKNE